VDRAAGLDSGVLASALQLAELPLPGAAVPGGWINLSFSVMTQILVNCPYEYIPWHLHSLARNETSDLRKHHPLCSRFGFVLLMDVDAENPYNTFIIEEV
jgi:hypothetical protein